jgi:hypothetical protein
MSPRCVCRPLFALLLLATAACDNHLETGYKFRPLSASDDEKRAYYAPAFSRESRVDHDDAKSPVLQEQ